MPKGQSSVVVARQGVGGALLAGVLLGVGATAWAAGPKAESKVAVGCSQVQLELTMERGKSEVRRFAAGASAAGQGEALAVAVQALDSGWIVRVVPAAGAWGEHDRAELATPPFRSPNPLLLSTDFAFRAQDAVAWNPRRFRYAATTAAYGKLLGLYPKVLAGDAAATGELARISGEQPEGTVQILDATLAPGTANQWRMAAAVASHLESTPHREALGVAPSQLGTLVALKLRVTLELPQGWRGAPGLPLTKILCSSRPTE